MIKMQKQAAQKRKLITVPQVLKRNIGPEDRTLVVGPGIIIRDLTPLYIGKKIGTKNLLIIDVQDDSKKKYNDKYGYGGVVSHRQDWEGITEKQGTPTLFHNWKRSEMPLLSPSWVKGRALQMPIKPDSIDRIVDHSTHEYIHWEEYKEGKGDYNNIKRLLNEYIRILQPGGKVLLFSTENISGKINFKKERIESILHQIDPNIKVTAVPLKREKFKHYISMFPTKQRNEIKKWVADDVCYKDDVCYNIVYPSDYVLIIRKP